MRCISLHNRTLQNAQGMVSLFWGSALLQDGQKRVNTASYLTLVVDVVEPKRFVLVHSAINQQFAIVLVDPVVHEFALAAAR